MHQYKQFQEVLGDLRIPRGAAQRVNQASRVAAVYGETGRCRRPPACPASTQPQAGRPQLPQPQQNKSSPGTGMLYPALTQPGQGSIQKE